MFAYLSLCHCYFTSAPTCPWVFRLNCFSSRFIASLLCGDRILESLCPVSSIQTHLWKSQDYKIAVGHGHTAYACICKRPANTPRPHPLLVSQLEMSILPWGQLPTTKLHCGLTTSALITHRKSLTQAQSCKPDCTFTGQGLLINCSDYSHLTNLILKSLRAKLFSDDLNPGFLQINFIPVVLKGQIDMSLWNLYMYFCSQITPSA